MKFVQPASALRVDNKRNLGFCMEVERGVDWDECAEDVAGNEHVHNVGDQLLNLTGCFQSQNYTGSCFDAVWDVARKDFIPC